MRVPGIQDVSAKSALRTHCEVSDVRSVKLLSMYEPSFASQCDFISLRLATYVDVPGGPTARESAAS